MSTVPETPAEGPVRFPQCVPQMYPPPGGYPWGWAQPSPIAWSAFREEVLAYYAPPMRAKGTLLKIRQVLDAVGELIGPDATTAGLSPELVARFITARPAGQSPNTTFGMVATLRAVCSFAEGRLYIPVSPFRLRKQWVRKGRPKGKRHHSAEEIGRVLALMSRDVERKKGWAQWRARRLLALASTVAYTGLRRNEALYLKVDDIDMRRRIIDVVPRERHRLKTEDAAQPVPMPEALAVVLAEWLPHCGCEWAFPNAYRKAPWTGGSPGHKPLDRLKRLGQRAHVEGFTFQSLRHSWATHAESLWGLSPATIQRVLRHTTVRTQAHYRHADIPNLIAAVGRIGFDRPQGEVPAR